jgi:hypothetical protein
MLAKMEMEPLHPPPILVAAPAPGLPPIAQLPAATLTASSAPPVNVAVAAQDAIVTSSVPAREINALNYQDF